jgi:D-galactose 1-dehydrogenase
MASTFLQVDRRDAGGQCPQIDAVSLCMPPQYPLRSGAETALSDAGKHVFLEKPPGATLSEVADLEAHRRRQGRLALCQLAFALCAGRRSRQKASLPARRFAQDAGDQLEGRRAPLASRTRNGSGRPGGLGIFDPGHQRALDRHPYPAAARSSSPKPTLEFPENRDAPIAASDAPSATPTGPRCFKADFDWRQTGKQSWDIIAQTEVGEIVLSEGGAKLSIDGKLVHEEPEQEYPMLYKRFAEIVKAGKSDVDLAPLRHVADAFMLGRRKFVEAFHD